MEPEMTFFGALSPVGSLGPVHSRVTYKCFKVRLEHYEKVSGGTKNDIRWSFESCWSLGPMTRNSGHK